jgi:hypothetical protein
MLTMTPKYATLREEKTRQTIDWLIGNFELKPINKPVGVRANSKPEQGAAAKLPAQEAAQA